MFDQEQEIENYILNHTDPEDPVLFNLNRHTHLKTVNPRMLSGHLQGSFLTMVSKMIRPSFILEIGTFTGYSAICLAKGLAENGVLHTIDINDELRETNSLYIKEAGFEKQIKLHTGEALKIIPTFNFSFDLVFIDAEKNEYRQYYQLVFDKIKQGGYIIADNVLWSGKVADKQFSDEATLALRQFNDLIAGDSRVEKLILPIRDGLMMIRKK